VPLATIFCPHTIFARRTLPRGELHTFGRADCQRVSSCLPELWLSGPCLVGVCFVSLDILDGIGPKLPNKRRHALVDQHKQQSHQ